MNIKNYKNLIDENYEDALFAKLMDMHAQIEGSRLLEENKRLKNDLAFHTPYGLDERCMRTIDSAFKAKNRGKRHKKEAIVLRRVAVVMMICATLFTGLMCTASAFRESVFRLFSTQFNDNTDMQIYDVISIPSNEKNSEPIDEIPENLYLPTCLPEGYILTSLSCDDNQLKAIYSDNSGKQILYKELSDDFSYGIDTEDADEIETVLINGCEGVFVSKGEKLSVTWGNTNRRVLIRISSEAISKEALLKMARSVA